MISLLKRKEELLEYFEKRVNNERKEIFNYNYPILTCKPSGINVHPGVNCPHKCLYCYIEDEGANFDKPLASPFSSEELCLILLKDKYFIPGRDGSFIALGDLCDPFFPSIKEVTFSYIKFISSFFGNPIQFSTKMHLSETDVNRLREVVGNHTISPLVSISTLKNRKLEPNAPSPVARMKTIENLATKPLSGGKPAKEKAEIR